MPLAPSLAAPQQAASSDSSMRKLMRQIGQGAASGAAVVGNTLNKPSRALWGTLDRLAGGHGGGGLLNLIPFSDTMGLTDPSQGVEASQFLANRGIISQNDPNKWEAMDFGRGLIDAVGDPLGWVAPMGLTKAGVAATRAGTAAKGIIPSIARGERAILGLQAPFATKTFASLGTGASAAAGLQKAGAMAAKLPGASKAMKVGDGVRRWWKQAFDAKAMGARSAAGQAGGELASELSQKYAQSVDDVVIPAARELHQSGAGDGSVAQRAFGETGKAGRPITPVESTAVTSVQDLLSNLRLKAKSAGLKVGGLLKDVVDYLPRSLSGMPAKSRSRSMWSVVDPGDAERLQVLKGFHGGTEGVNTLFRDADIDKLVSTLKGSPAWLSDKKLRKQTIDTVEAMLRSKYGSVIEPTYQVKLRKGGVLQYDIDPVTGKKTPKMKDVDRIKQLAKKVVKMDDWRKNGVFNNHWLVDAQSRAQSLAHRTALAEAAVDVLAKNGKRGVPGTPLKDIIGKAGIGLDTDVAVNNILAARGKGSLASYGKKANAVRRRILNETVDDSVADDLMRAWPAFRTPPELNDLQKGWKNFTALWKAGQLTWPARYVRDLASASMRLWENGAIDPQSFKQAHNVLQGRAVPGLADIPAVVDHLRSRGVLPATGAVDDAMATNALRDLYGTHFTQPGGMLTDTLQTGSTANARPLSEITDRIPGLDPKSELQSIKEIGMRSVGRDPSGSPIPGSWNPLNVRGYGDNNRSTFGPVAAGDRVGTYTDSVARMTGFINRLRSGADPAAAAKEINNLLVDYSPKSFTPTERALKAFLPFYSFCVPTDHEIMTREGWKTFDQVSVGDLAMTMDHSTGKMEWQPIEAVNVFPHDGELIRWEIKKRTRTIAFEFTDNHRWPVLTEPGSVSWVNKSGSIGTTVRKVKRTWRLGHDLRRHDRIPCAGEFEGTESILSPRHAALLGWLVTDGYYRRRGNSWEGVIYQSPDKHLKDIVEITGTRPRKPHPQSGVVPVGVKAEDMKVLAKHLAVTANLPATVAALSREAADAMWDAMFKAEGSTSSKGNMHFAQSPEINQHVIDAFQILSMMTGRLANQSSRGCYVKRSKCLFMGRNLTRIPYSGLVWCPTTKNSTWVMRHNGAVVITGNSSRQIPYLAKELVMNPGGRTSQLVRGTARAQSNDPFLPEHISQTTAIPIGQSEDGTKRFVTGFGLMHEDPLSFLGGGVQGAMTETMSRMNPIPKSVIEWGTGESLFQRGPMGGRDLGDMDPTIGRLLSNIGESTGLMEPGSGPVRFPAQTPIEFVIGNSPFSRAASTARSAFDPRKSAAAKMANILTGTRVSDVSTKTQDAVLRDAATKLGKEIGAKEFSSIRFRKQDIANLEKVDPAAAEMAKAFNNLQNQLSGRVKARNNNTGSAKSRKTVSKPEGARL